MLDSQSWGKTILRNVAGFTLAEVLITIAVIGVVAAIVIPALLKNTNGRETVTALRKYQSVFSEAVKRYMVDNGCNGDMSTCDAFSGETDNNKAGTALASYFSIQKNCTVNSGQGCWTPGFTYKFINNSDETITRDNSSFYKFILNDGVSVMIGDYNGNCNSDYTAPPPNTSSLLYSVCGWITVDINGNKSPNKWGRDSFAFRIIKNGQVIPYGAFDDKHGGCNPGSDDVTGDADGAPGMGYGCTYKVLHEGAVNY